MEIKVHDFEVSGGETIKEGKANWPDCLNINISKKRVLPLIEQLAKSLHYLEEGELHITLNFMGKLDYDIDEFIVNNNSTSKSCPKGGKHEWGIDGVHSNQYCKKCFIDRPAISVKM